MKYRILTGTGATVSKICLGTMTFGSQVDEADAIRMVHRALDAGVNFVDTADVYAGNESERIVGDALAEGGRRANTILATKFNFPQGEDVNARGLSRRHLIVGAGTVAVSGWAVANRSARAQEGKSAEPVYTPAQELVVQPALTYATPQPRKQTSWRSWGGIQTEAHADEEVRRIGNELRKLVASSGMAIELLPVAKVRTPDQAGKVGASKCDVMLVYAAGAHRGVLEAHNNEQAEPRWPWTVTSAYNVDRDLSQEDQSGDEFAYWSN